MNRSTVALITVASLLALPEGARGQAPSRLSAPDAHPVVSGVLLLPDTVGEHPAVILLPGAGGWRPEYLDFARALTGAGFVTLTLDYYAGSSGGGGPGPLDDEVRNLPPLLILHGTADRIVPLGLAWELLAACRRAGRIVELHTYSGARHGFTIASLPTYSPRATADATARAVRFFRRWLAST
jgi:dienelactone hydrolase